MRCHVGSCLARLCNGSVIASLFHKHRSTLPSGSSLQHAVVPSHDQAEPNLHSGGAQIYTKGKQCTAINGGLLKRSAHPSLPTLTRLLPMRSSSARHIKTPWCPNCTNTCSHTATASSLPPPQGCHNQGQCSTARGCAGTAMQAQTESLSHTVCASCVHVFSAHPFSTQHTQVSCTPTH